MRHKALVPGPITSQGRINELASRLRAAGLTTMPGFLVSVIGEVMPLPDPDAKIKQYIVDGVGSATEIIAHFCRQHSRLSPQIVPEDLTDNNL